MGPFNQQITKIHRRLAEILEQAQELSDDPKLPTQDLADILSDLKKLQVARQESPAEAKRPDETQAESERAILQAILAARSVEEIASATLQRIPQLLDCLYTCITLYDLEAREMSLLAAYSGGEITLNRNWRAIVDDEWARAMEVLTQGLEYSIEDVQRISPTSEWWRTLQTEGVRALVTLPLIIEGTLIGSLNLGLHRPGPLTADQMEVARELVIPLAIGIQQARLYEQVQHRAGELEKEVQRRIRALRASEARFRTIFEETATGIVRINHKGQMLDSNPALQTMLGYSDEELHGQPFTEFARHPDDIGVDADLLTDLLADRQSSYRQKVRYIRKNGQTVWANLTISTVRKGQYTSPLAIAMVEDITEQKQAEEALIQSEKLALAGQLAASLAHEINNPLQSVIGCLGLAQESLADKDDPGPLLQIAMEELRRAAGIVGDMRDFNRPTDPGEREPTDLNALIEQVLTLSEKKCREHQVNVQWKRVDSLPNLMLAPNRIHQVFLNLTLNAVEAMPDGGELRIQTAPTDDPEGVRVTFADTGIGIASDKLPHIFDPFYTTKDDGLGLGLFISRNIVREHGGKVKAQSQVGEGTTFTVWLPTGD